MDSGDTENLPNHMTYSKSTIPVIGALIDYMDTSVEYVRRKTFAQAEQLHAKVSRATLSASFMAAVCLLLGIACNVKFEVVTLDEEPLSNDLHFMIMSREEKLYIDDIDVSRVMWCLEASDTLVVLISCLLIWNSSHVRSPLSEYLFLPWLGAALRGLFLRQAPTAGALLYTMAIINGNVNPLFLTAFSFLFRSDDSSEEALSFSRHLLSTKYWFARISWANKKRYVLALLEDVRSAWALSLLLKSMWNCRPKDAILSISEPNIWSSYDQVPLDHNRTAIPVATLAQVMKSDRIWFLSLGPEAQAMVLSELLTVSGGPVMWEVLRRAKCLYDHYRDQQLRNLEECIVINDSLPEKSSTPLQATPEKDLVSRPYYFPSGLCSYVGKGKKEVPSAMKRNSVDGSPRNDEFTKTPTQPGRAQKELETNLLAWNATIKTMRDNLKLEEVEMRFNDGTTRKIWKVNRPKPEVVETVDFVQLLPSSIGKRILSYLPRAQLGECARVNKYWAYLADEFRVELTARQKINADFEKLQESMLRHDTSMEMVAQIEYRLMPASSQAAASVAPSTKIKQPPPSMRASEKSGGAYSLRLFISDKLTKPVIVQKPIRNMAELSERLDRRGATDENVWTWCENILKHIRKHKKDLEGKGESEGVLPLGNVNFPCPMMKQTISLPLYPPLYKDPAISKSVKPRRNISNATVLHIPKEHGVKRYSLWAKDFSGLYPVFKIPSYQSPV